MRLRVRRAESLGLRGGPGAGLPGPPPPFKPFQAAANDSPQAELSGYLWYVVQRARTRPGLLQGLPEPGPGPAGGTAARSPGRLRRRSGVTVPGQLGVNLNLI
jgi:hypothetical protein